MKSKEIKKKASNISVHFTTRIHPHIPTINSFGLHAIDCIYRVTALQRITMQRFEKSPRTDIVWNIHVSESTINTTDLIKMCILKNWAPFNISLQRPACLFSTHLDAFTSVRSYFIQTFQQTDVKMTAWIEIMMRLRVFKMIEVGL